MAAAISSTSFFVSLYPSPNSTPLASTGTAPFRRHLDFHVPVIQRTGHFHLDFIPAFHQQVRDFHLPLVDVVGTRFLPVYVHGTSSTSPASKSDL